MTSPTLKLTVASLLLSPVLALASVPTTLAFSARIADGGKPVTGTQSFVFRLWNDPTASDTTTNLVWMEPATSATSLPVNDGVVTAALGDVANGGVALPAFDGTPLWLEVTMGTTVFAPRIAIHAVPYALRAAETDHALAADSAASVPWTGITGIPPGMGGVLACQQLSASVSIAAGASGLLDTAACSSLGAGWQLTGGGCAWTGVTPAYLTWCLPTAPADGPFRGQLTNATGAAGTLWVYARCCHLQ